MKLKNAIRVLPGTMVRFRPAMARWVDAGWLLLAAFTGFCPAAILLRRIGVGKDAASCCR